MPTLTDAIGFAAGGLTAVCFVPQIIHTLKRRRADDVSTAMLLLTILSVSLYEIYAWRLGLVPVIVMNGVFFILVVVELVLKIHFAKANTDSDPSSVAHAPKHNDD